MSCVDLRMLMRRVADWVDVNWDQFLLYHARSVDQRIFLIKPLGELALTAALLLRAGHLERWSKDKLDRIWNELGGGDTLLQVLAARPDLIVASTLYASFRKAGYRNSRLDLLVEHLAGTASCGAIEFPAWRRLDVAHGLDALGISPFPRKPTTGTWIAARPEPWLITDDIAYAVTHEIFYITDFGTEVGRLPDAIFSYVVTWLPAWLEIYARQENWDLYAEFVMVGACLHQGQGNAVRHLAAQVQPEGYVSGPRGSAANLLHPAETTERSRFLRNYHTTLVAMMAFSLCLRLRPNDRSCSHSRS
jgi:hypothetical protein